MRFENLPINWKLVHLVEISEINMGQSPPSATYNYENEGLPFFQGKTDFGLIYPTKRVWCNEPKKIVNKDEILLSVRAPVGPTNIALEKSCIGRGLCGLKYIIDENSKFIFYFFRSIEKELSQLGTGSTFQAISKSQISNFLFLLFQNSTA
ncbi:MAG: restriction endonuclease subunit S [Bacteroidetes bacterium]|nr:restriction endonuclease subunit S [Bacteroidota bacterium]